MRENPVAIDARKSRRDRCAKIPLGSMREDPVGIDARGSRRDRGPRIPLGSLQIDPGGIAYGSRGLPRSGAPPERAHKRGSIPEGSQMDMRPRCGRRVAHVRVRGCSLRSNPRLPYVIPLGSGQGGLSEFLGVRDSQFA